MSITIEELQNKIYHNNITNIRELEDICKPLDIDPYEDVLFPMGYNSCDRCGSIQDSEVELIWLDCIDWDNDNPEDQVILANLGKAETDYCAVCDDCLKELKEKK